MSPAPERPPEPTEPPCLRPFLAWILGRHAGLGGLTEVRILRKGQDKGTWSGGFAPGDLDALADALRPLDGGPRETIPRRDHPRSGEANIYFSLQAVQPERLQSRRGRLSRQRTAARDRDILAYTLFVVDIDPERTPRDSSASAPEKAKALEVATRVQAWLRERGAESMLADSGNGWHLLVPLIPATGEGVVRAAEDARDLLRLLDRRFSTPAAKVDTTTYNPSRILKLYGTMAVKGTPSLERPHRMASISLASVPRDLDLFAAVSEDLEDYRAELRARGTQRRSGDRTSSSGKAPGRGRSSRDDGAWKAWRQEALAQLPLEAVYGELLTGGPVRSGWMECRDPDSPSGDRNPSAGVADGSGEPERGTFHSFLDNRTESVFDFMIARGMASGMREACDRVAALSGVPVPPSQRRLVEPADVLARLELSWEDADDDARPRLLRAALGELAGQPADRRQDALRQLRELTGHSTKVLLQVLAELRREAKKAKKRQRAAQPPPPARSGRPVVDYLTNGDTVAALFDAIIEAIAPARRFFRSQGDVVFVRRGHGPTVVTERNLPGLLAALIEVRFMRHTEDGLRFQRYGVLPAELARAFTCDPRVWSSLPELHLYCRSPVFAQGWSFVGVPGYHPALGVYYDGPPVQPTDGHPEQLEVALRDFHWKGEADLVNFVGALITALTIPMWGRGHPFLAVNGNKPGVGKTTLARVLGVLVEGSEPSTVSYVPDEAEFEKQLATRVEAGDRVIVIDNAKTRKPIESPVLERCVTDSRLNFRRLGSNTSISRQQNDILFCLTMNLTALGTDLRRRALPVNLHLERDTRSTHYGMDDVVGFVQQRRLGIVAELAGMVQAWVNAGRPRCQSPAQHSTSQAWAGTMDGILRLSGFNGFLTNFDDSTHAFDPNWEAMIDACQRYRSASFVSAGEWAERLAEGPLEDRFTDRRGTPKSKRSRSTVVGHLFRGYLGEELELDGKRFSLVAEHPRGPSHPPVYGFREVGA